MSIMLEVRHFSDTAHKLPDTEFLATKGCANLHGHTYAYIVRFDSDELKGGMVIDFKFIKQLIDTLDHKTLVYRPAFQKLYDFLFDEKPEQVMDFPYIPSSENIGIYLKDEIQRLYPQLNHIEVWVCEGYKGQERANWTVAK